MDDDISLEALAATCDAVKELGAPPLLGCVLMDRAAPLFDAKGEPILGVAFGADVLIHPDRWDEAMLWLLRAGVALRREDRAAAAAVGVLRAIGRLGAGPP